jgi:hypothetical protein
MMELCIYPPRPWHARGRRGGIADGDGGADDAERLPLSWSCTEESLLRVGPRVVLGSIAAGVPSAAARPGRAGASAGPGFRPLLVHLQTHNPKQSLKRGSWARVWGCRQTGSRNQDFVALHPKAPDVL